MVRYTDETLMPFGMHKGKALANVPATYLIYLYDNGLDHPGVKRYIEDNMEILRRESNKVKAVKGYRR